MLKKTLLASAFALSVVSIGSFANGNGNGDENLTAIKPMAAMPTGNFIPNIYMGVQAGYGMSGWENFDKLGNLKVTNDANLAGRLFVGYSFHKNFGVELGYMAIGKKAKLIANIEDESSNSATSVQLASIRTQAFDLVGKLSVPVNDVVDVYAKAGVNYLMSSGLNKSNVGEIDGLFTDSHLHHFGPAFGVGMSYNITETMFADVSWMHYEGNHSMKTHGGDRIKYQPSVDFIGVGIGGKFNI